MQLLAMKPAPCPARWTQSRAREATSTHSPCIAWWSRLSGVSSRGWSTTGLPATTLSICRAWDVSPGDFRSARRCRRSSYGRVISTAPAVEALVVTMRPPASGWLAPSDRHLYRRLSAPAGSARGHIRWRTAVVRPQPAATADLREPWCARECAGSAQCGMSPAGARCRATNDEQQVQPAMPPGLPQLSQHHAIRARRLRALAAFRIVRNESLPPALWQPGSARYRIQSATACGSFILRGDSL